MKSNNHKFRPVVLKFHWEFEEILYSIVYSLVFRGHGSPEPVYIRYFEWDN